MFSHRVISVPRPNWVWVQDSDPGRYYHDLGEEFGDVERTRLLRSSTGLRSWALLLPFFFLMQAARSFKGQRAARYLEFGLYVIEVVLMQPCPYQYPGESRIGTGFKVIKCVSSCLVTRITTWPASWDCSCLWFAMSAGGYVRVDEQQHNSVRIRHTWKLISYSLLRTKI